MKKILLLAFLLLSTNVLVKAQFLLIGNEQRKTSVTTLPPNIDYLINCLWDIPGPSGRCMYYAGLPGSLSDWNFDNISDKYIQMEYINGGVNNFSVMFYITYSDWVRVGKPYKWEFCFYDKRNESLYCIEMWIPYNNGGMLE